MASMDKGLTLKTRNLTCYCLACKSGDGDCKNCEYVDDWKVRTLELDEAELRRQSGVTARPGRPKKKPASKPKRKQSNTTSQPSKRCTVVAAPTQTAVPPVAAAVLVSLGSYVAMPVKPVRKRTFLYIAVVTDIDNDHMTVRYLKKVSDAGMFKESNMDDHSTESLKDVLFVCPEPQIAALGMRIRYIFDFTHDQKHTMIKYTVR